MSKTILCLTALILATAAHAEEPRFKVHTTRDGGGYEATLRSAGIPQSAGMVWAVVRPADAAPAVLAGKPDSAVRAAAVEVTKKKTGA